MYLSRVAKRALFPNILFMGIQTCTACLLIASRPALSMLPMSLLFVPRHAASQCSFYGSLCIVCQCSFTGDPDIVCLQVFLICVSKHALFAYDPTMSIRTCTVYGNPDCLPIRLLWVSRYVLIDNTPLWIPRNTKVANIP